MQSWLSDIAAKASTLRERLSPDFDQVDGCDELVDARMQAWLAASARGDREAFRRRLTWDVLDEHTARRAVAPVRLRSAAQLPSWTATLAEVLRLAPSSTTSDRCLDPQNPLPFEDLFIPFIVSARSACARQAALAYQAFTAEAHAALERDLLRSLSGIAGRTLLVELRGDAADKQLALDLPGNGEQSRELYNEFVARMLAGGLTGFFQEYAALGRLLATTSMLWVEATAELLQRFDRDRDDIRAAFGTTDGIYVAGVEPCESDPHNGLRRVAILRLGCGERLVYKPRPMKVEAVFNDLLEFCANLGAPVDFRTYRILDRGEYGWTEYVVGVDVEDGEQASRYVERAGALLAIVYLLGGTDCHADNIIAVGEYPVLIDVETMLSPKVRDGSAHADAPRAAHAILWQSVLSSYLLPWWSSGVNNGEVVDASAFGAMHAGAPAFSRLCWVDLNTDNMRIMRVSSAGGSLSAAATQGEVSRSVYGHEAELISGFESMYKFLAGHQDELLRPNSPFQRFRCSTVRFVYRNTAFYAAILDRLTLPEFLREGAERSIEIEQLAYAALTGERVDGRSGWAAIWRSERDAVERGDVPHFTATPGASAVGNGCIVVVPAWFPKCSHDTAIERLRSLNDFDLGFQVDMIRSAIQARETFPEARSCNCVDIAIAPGPQDSQVWVEEALAIAQQLAEQAIRGADGSICWIQRAWSRELQTDPPVADLQATGNDLYSGAPGIALFLAALERVAPGCGMLPFALGAIRPLIEDLSASGDDVVEQIGIGGLFGIGSAAYALTCLGDLLGRADLMEYAEHAASLITEERIALDAALDVTSGSSGALLALLALYEANGTPFALARATKCGQRLLARLEELDNNLAAIRTLEGRFLTGFAHGQAGIAYSLCRLYRATGDSTFLHAAKRLIAFERSSYSPTHGNWPDLRHPGLARFMPSWCHGAPGIALARVATVDVLDQAESHSEIDRALAITQEHVPGDTDCVCCGKFGRVEILWTAGRVLRRAELSGQAQGLAWQSVLDARRNRDYAPALGPVGRFRCLGLFQGVAGIGYTMLRLAFPDVVPQVLLLNRATT